MNLGLSGYKTAARRHRVPLDLVSPVTGVLVIAALVALFAHEDPREFVGESTTFGTSDIVTHAEAAVSLVLTSLVLAVGWRFASRYAMSA